MIPINMRLPKTDTDTNIVAVIKERIRLEISEKAAEEFENTGDLIEVQNYIEPIQIIFINIALREIIYRYSGKHNIRVLDVIPFIVDGIPYDEWLTVFDEAVLTFLKKNNILGE